MNFNHDTGSIDTILNLDTSVAPPGGGTAGVLTVTGTGGIIMPVGTTAQRPSGAPFTGTSRYNSSTGFFEGYNGSTWEQFRSGTVTSVAATGSTGLSVSGSPITGSGTLTLTLASELQGLSGARSNGFTVRTSDSNPPTYESRSITGSSPISVTNGDGVAGNPVISLNTVTDSGTGAFRKITVDSYGRVTGTTAVTASDITALVDNNYVNTTGDTMTGSIVFSGGATVTGIPLPVLASDAANKSYVDSAVTGLSWKQSVRVATTGPVTLTTLTAGITVDGVVLAAGDRVLVKNQTTPSENGIYVIDNAGVPPTRSTDANVGSELVGATVFVDQGTANATTGWTQISDDPLTLGSSSIVFVQFSGSGTYTAGAGLTLVGNTFSLASPVAINLGGTGLSAIGGANTLLGVNAGGSAYEAKTFVAGSGVNINHSGANITISSSAVTSVGLSMPSIFAVSGSPVTSSGTLSATLNTQTANTVFAGPTIGTAAIPTFRSLIMADLPIKLLSENVSSPITPVSSGTNATAIGSGAFTNVWGAKVFANDRFTTSGDAQHGVYILRCLTSSAAATQMYLDSALTQRIIPPLNSVWTFSALIVARRTDTTGGSAGYKIEGVVKKDGTASTIAFVGTPNRTVLGETNSAWNVTAGVDTTDGSLIFTVVGEAAKTIRWVNTVMTTEVGQ